MKPDIEKLRKKYMDNPPEGMTSEDIRRMSEDNLLDMDYFLNEDDLFADEAGVEGSYIFYAVSSNVYARLRAGYFQFQRTPQTVFPIKKKSPEPLILQ